MFAPQCLQCLVSEIRQWHQAVFEPFASPDMDLMALTDYPEFDCAGANEAFFQWKKHKKENIMTFRDNGYKSALTGTMAPAHHTPWKDALDDSLEAYLQT